MHTLEVQKKIERDFIDNSRAAWVQSLADAGLTQAEAARHAEMSQGLICKIIGRHRIKGFKSGNTGNGKTTDPDKLAMFTALVSEGLNANEMSERTGLEANNIRNFLDRNGLKAAAQRKKPKTVSVQIYENVRRLIDAHGWSFDEISNKTGIPVDRIRGIAEARR